MVPSHQGLGQQGRTEGGSFMAHKSSYTLLLLQWVGQAGFVAHAGWRLPTRFELWVLASPVLCEPAQMRTLASRPFLRTSIERTCTIIK